MAVVINGTTGIDKVQDGSIQTADLAANAVTTAKIADTVNLGRRNLIINGDMRISQRATSATSSNDSGYLAVDRFVYDTRVNAASSGDFTLEQVTDAPTGFQYSYKITNVDNTIVSSSGGVEFMQFIEGYDTAHLKWGTAEAKGVTFSFWVKASYTGTQSIYFPSSDYGIVWLDSFTIDAANTWEYKTFYIEGPTSGTWNTTTGRGIMARINLCNGGTAGTEETWNQSNSVVSGQTQTFGTTTSSTFQITGVQLEVGDTATPFEHRSYGEEEALCQRYFYASDNGEMNCVMGTSTEGLGMGSFPVKMRAAPTAYASGGGAINTADIRYFNGSATLTTFTTCSTSRLGIQYFSVVGSGTQGLPVRPFPLWFDAEI